MDEKTSALNGLLDESGTIKIGHGAGGLMSQALIDFLIKGIEHKHVNGGTGLEELDDGATIPIEGTDKLIVVTSDAHTVEPLFFPGGDLGKLAVCGTINDILVMGARPLAITHAIIIEEGFQISELKKLNQSFVETANKARIAVIAGDTKVMPKNTLNGCISATTGIGIVSINELVQDSGLQPGDEIIVSGTIGDHGTALLACRHGISFETDILSDVAMVTNIVNIAMKYRPSVMKDPTRGGLASTLNEIASKSRVSIWLDEEKIPFQQATISACNMLGLNPFELASEGRVIIGVKKGKGQELVDELKKLPGCSRAEIIGEARQDRPGKVFIKTQIGGTRILSTPLGEPIPRVC
ncbi:MAG: hydrogenase expression/formation protein HypE [Promethearchaeota archaeon]